MVKLGIHTVTTPPVGKIILHVQKSLVQNLLEGKADVNGVDANGFFPLLLPIFTRFWNEPFDAELKVGLII
jgi:hypothetical protein